MAVLRIDKWLWAVRVFKTRSMATEACRAGKVKLDGHGVKASHEVKVGEVYDIRSGMLLRNLKVLGFPLSRVGAKLVPEYMLELTPQAELEKIRLQREAAFYFREPGAGRPTKKERRLYDQAGGPIPVDDGWADWANSDLPDSD
jgi:ribosome-associated heat shock protein Hsp15